MPLPIVYIVEDDAAVRDGLSLLFESGGFSVKACDSAEVFLATYRVNRPGCIVVDLQMGGMSGLQLQAEIARRGGTEPIIFLSAHGDSLARARAMEGGAAAFFTKPVDGALLLGCVRAAIAKTADEDEP